MSVSCRYRALLLVTLTSCGLPAFGQGAYAADWSCSPSIHLAEEYNSNILLGSIYELEDFVTRVRPGLEVAGITEQTQFLFDTAVPVELYIDHDGFNTVDNSTSVSLKNQWNPQVSTYLGAHFVKDTTLETELEAAGLREDRSDRQRYGFDFEGEYLTSARASLRLRGSMEKSRFPQGTYPDQLHWRVGLNPSWIVAPGKTVGLYADYDDSEYANTTTNRTVSGTVYWQHEWTEKAYYTVGAGYYHTWLDRETFGIESEDDGFLFNLALNNSWTERLSTVLSAGNGQYNTVDARSVLRTYVRAAMDYRLSHVLRAGCNVGYNFTTQSGPLGQDSHYVRVEPSLWWELATNVSLRFYGGYGNLRTDRATGEQTADRFLGGIALQADWPRLLANN